MFSFAIQTKLFQPTHLITPDINQSQFFFVMFCLARQRGVYSSPSQRTVICKDTTQKISCPPQQRIRILNADYGDTGDVGCLKEANPMPTGVCRTPGAYETVKRHCDGLEDCDLYASNGVFGDACPDANKYLDVNYDCMNNPGKLIRSCSRSQVLVSRKPLKLFGPGKPFLVNSILKTEK